MQYGWVKLFTTLSVIKYNEHKLFIITVVVNNSKVIILGLFLKFFLYSSVFYMLEWILRIQFQNLVTSKEKGKT